MSAIPYFLEWQYVGVTSLISWGKTFKRTDKQTERFERTALSFKQVRLGSRKENAENDSLQPSGYNQG